MTEPSLASTIGDAQRSLDAAQAMAASLQAQLAQARSQISSDAAVIAQLQAQLAACGPGKAPAPPAGWVEVYRDDMHGALGGGWTVANNDSASNELSLRLAANVVPASDHVSIVAKRQAVGSHSFTSGYISTSGHCSIPAGRWLARMRWTDAYGLWPAFWLRFDKAPGEIDGMEAVGGVRKILQTAHQSTSGAQDKSGSEWAMPAGWSPSDWHVYGIERQADGTVVWSIDGQTTKKITTADLSTKLRKPMTWLVGPEYAGPAHLIVNLQVGGSMPSYYGQTDLAKILPGTATGSLDIGWVQVLTPSAAG